jgi:uncharacterized protein YkwD
MRDHPLWVAVCTAALTVLALVATAHAAPRQDRVEQGVVDVLSRERARHGLPALHPARRLARVADVHSAEMADSNVLYHGAVAQRVRPVVPNGKIGETIAVLGGPGGLAQRVVNAWLNSPPHRAILLDGSLRRVGVARRAGADGWFFTADLAARKPH